MKIINRSFSISDFKTYVDTIDINLWLKNPSLSERLQFPVVHNTSAPTQALYRSWHDRSGWTIEQWGKNLTSYYSGLGWTGCPHLFVGYDKILVLNSLNIRGTHTPSWNRISWGIETVGDFDKEPFDDGVRTNLIAAVAILCAKANFNPAKFELGKSGIHFHKEDKNTTHKSCPGKNLVKLNFVSDVVEYMNNNLSKNLIAPVFSEDHPHISEASQIFNNDDMSSEELTSIKWVQSQLNRLKVTNPILIVDGIVGKKTKDAVKKFQWEKSLIVDGIAGPITRKALKDARI